MKYVYRHTTNYNKAAGNNGYGDAAQEIYSDIYSYSQFCDGYNFSEYLKQIGKDFDYTEFSDGTWEYIILDADEEPTPERYIIDRISDGILHVKAYPVYMKISDLNDGENYEYDDIAAGYDPQYVDSYTTEEDAEKAAEKDIRDMIDRDFPDANEQQKMFAAIALFNSVSPLIEWAWNDYNENK